MKSRSIEGNGDTCDAAANGDGRDSIARPACAIVRLNVGDLKMRFLPVVTLLPLVLLAACQNTGQTGASPTAVSRQCPPRMRDAGQCNSGTIYSFPELSNIR